MPDVTDQILAERNPLYDPLSPTVEDIKTYAEELEEEMALLMQPVNGQISKYAFDVAYESNTITYEWATNEILNHQDVSPKTVAKAMGLDISGIPND